MIGRLTPLVGARQLELPGPGHEFRPIFDGTRVAGPVDPVDAWRDGHHLSFAVLVTELPAGRCEVLWNDGSEWQMQDPGGLLRPELTISPLN